MLASALRRLDESSNRDDHVYALETCTGIRKYVVMTPDTAWKRTCGQAPAHLYEVLSGPCNVYLDIEWVCDKAPGASIEQARVRDAVQHVCSCLQQIYGETCPLVTSVSASGNYGDGYKCSWHVHIACNTVCWLNALAVGQFVRSTCKDVSIVDKVPYAGTGQNWRCVGSAKYAEPSRTFRPVDEQTFMCCTVQQPVSGRRVIYPDVSLPSVVAPAVPAYVRDLARTLGAGSEPIMCSETRCIVPFRARQYCEHVGRYHRSNHQYAVINVSTLMWKMKCHACADAVCQWRTFEDTDAVLVAFKAGNPNPGNAALPATRVDGNIPGSLLDIRPLGPPPPSCSHTSVRCRDGVYMWHNPA